MAMFNNGVKHCDMSLNLNRLAKVFELALFFILSNFIYAPYLGKCDIECKKVKSLRL